MNLKLLYTVHALQGSKALQRHLGGPRHKLKESSSVCLVKGAQGSPEPLNLRVREMRGKGLEEFANIHSKSQAEFVYP